MTEKNSSSGKIPVSRSGGKVLPGEINPDLNVEVLKGTGVSFSGSLVGKLVNFVFHFLFARFFGADQYGIYTLGDTVINISKSLATLGTDRGGVLKLIGLYEGQGDFQRLKGAVLGALRLTLGSSLLFTLLIWLVTPFLSASLFQKPALQEILVFQAAALPFHVLLLMTAAVAQARRQMKYNALLLSIVMPATNLLGLLTALLLGFDLRGLAISIAVMMALSGLPSLWVLGRTTLSPFRDHDPLPVNREMIRVSLPILLVYISTIVFNQADKLFLGAYVSSAMIGIYNVAYRQVWTLQLVILSLGIFPPIVADLYAQERIEELQTLYRNIIRWVLAVIFPLFLLLLLFPRELMSIFGSEYIPGWPVLVILAFFPLVGGLTALTSPVLRMTGNQRSEAAAAVVSMVFNLAANLILVRNFGVHGIAVSLVLTILLRETWKMILVKVRIGILPYDLRLLSPLAAGLLDAGVILGIRQLEITVQDWRGALLEAGVFILIYLGLAWLLFPEEDKQLVLRGIGKLLGTLSAGKQGGGL